MAYTPLENWEQTGTQTHVFNVRSDIFVIKISRGRGGKSASFPVSHICCAEKCGEEEEVTIFSTLTFLLDMSAICVSSLRLQNSDKPRVLSLNNNNRSWFEFPIKSDR